MKRNNLPGGYSPTFYLAFLASLLFFSSIHLLIIPLPLYIEEMGGGPPEVGLAMTTFALAAIALRPYMGRLVDAWGRKPVMLIGATVFILGPLSYTVARSVPLLLVARFFHGVGIAAFTTAYFALVADVTPRRQWGAAIGLAGIAPPVSMILASPLGTSLMERMSFPFLFLCASLTALCSLVITLLLQEPARESTADQHGNPTKLGLLEIVRLRGVWAPSLATVTLGLSYGAVYSFLPLFGRDRGLGNVGFFFTASAIAIILSRLLAGRLSDRLGRVPVILPMFAVLALSMAGLNWAYGFATLVAMAIMYGAGFGGARVGLDTIVIDSAPGTARGTALGLLYFCFDSGIAMGGMLIGVLASLLGYGSVYLLVGAICLLTMALFAAVMRQSTTV